jgi:PAS domain S-box-containing protein
MRTPLRVLIVEDSEFDARILVNLLRAGGYEPAYRRVETARTLTDALREEPWELVLSDYNLPDFNASEALRIVQASGLDVPFIVISGGIGEDIAVGMMKAGAHDYLMKGHLARLVPAVARELRDAASRVARRKAEEAMRESELRYRTLWENSADAVIMMDTDSVIHFANPAAQLIFGYTPEELVGQNLALLLPERALGAQQESLVKCLRHGVRELERHVVETIGLRKDSLAVIVEIVCKEIDFQGRHWYVAFVRDVTERRQQEAELREHEEQFRVAREIQERLFPKEAPKLPGFDIAGKSVPAEAAGGDYFDYVPMLNNRLGIVVGDVTGHGIGPALLMAETRAYLRILARNREDTAEILGRANLVLAEDVGSERFVTMFLAALNPAERNFTYASAGHCAGFLLGADGALRATLKRTGPALGLRKKAVFKSAPPMPLQAGDLLAAVSDGVEETHGADGAFFGKERALQVLRDNRQRPATEIVEALYQAVSGFAATRDQMDDFTVVVVKVV